MRTHRLFVVVGLFMFTWGCGASAPPENSASKQPEAKVRKQTDPSGCNPNTLTASPPSPEPSGTPILLTADAGCVPTPESEYRFLYKPIGGESCGHGDGCGPWIELRGWGESTFTFDTTGLVPGRYRLRAQGRTDDEGNSSRTITYEFTEPCPPGYHSEGFDVCVDIDECLTNNGGCDPLTLCTNTPGSRECGPCPSGYTGDGYIGCTDIDECLTNNGGCDPLTLCTNVPGSRSCGPCPSGYTGDGEIGCTDIDECATENGGCDILTTCTNTPGSRICGPCPSGYTGNGEIGCVDIDECATGNGACDPLAVCTNLPGTRSCGPCPPSPYTGQGDTACMVPFSASELVGRPTDHSITINVMAGQVPAVDGGAGGYQALEVYFEYGTEPAEPGLYPGSTTPMTFADGIIETVISGLDPDTHYYYRMRYRPSGSTAPFLAGSEHTFQTQRLAGSTFKFAVKSDSHQGYTSGQFWNETLYQITMGNIGNDQADFLFDLGDAVSTDDATETQASVRQKYLNQRTTHDIVGHSVPVFLALGNHENEEGWNLDDMDTTTGRANSLPVLGANGRKRFFLNPVPGGIYTGNTDATVTEIDDDHLKEDYYAFTWGDALFVVIDPFWYTMKKPYSGSTGGEKDDENPVGNRWDWTLGDGQYQWLKQTLESSTAAFTFVFAHQATGGVDDYIRGGARGAKYCEWGGYDPTTNNYEFATRRPGWDLPIHQLFVHNNVTAFFHGHDHVFVKETLDGVVYQEVPFSASPAYNTGFADNSTYYASSDSGLINDSGHLRVTVTPTKATVDYVRSFLPGGGTNEQVSYTYEMVPCYLRDADGDGAKDCYETDACPNNPNKTAPGGVCGGCDLETDSDADGTPDCQDGCPTDPLKTAPGVCGCGLPESQPCNFMVVRVGTGSGGLSLASTAAFIEERHLGDGALVGSPIALPTAQTGSNRPLTVSGSAPVEGTLKRSVDGHFVTLSGYAVGPGTANVAYTKTSVVNRVVGRIAADHTVDTTTLFLTAFSGTGKTADGLANDRAVASYDGSAFWVAGAGANTNTGGIWYIPWGTSSATQIAGQSGNLPNNVRTCDIFGGRLYGATNVAPFYGVFTMVTDRPVGQETATLLNGFPTSGSSSPVDFAVLDRDPNIAGMDTIYLADSRALGTPSAPAGGIQKWTFDGSTWTLAYTLVNGLPTGVNHLLAIETPTGVVLLAEAGGSGNSGSGNSVVRVFDTGSDSTATTIATAGSNTAFRGLALSPY